MSATQPALKMRSIKRQVLSRGYKFYGDVIAKLMGDHTLAPAVIIWEPTMRCNLECTMCGYNQQGLLNNGAQTELSFEEIKTAIQNVKRAYKGLPYLPFIGFTGGEPFLRKDLEDIGAELTKEGFKYSITSNFTAVIPKRIDKLLKNPPADMRISLDGVSEIHNSVRGKGMFEKTYANAKYFVQASDGKVPLHINCAVSPTNARGLSLLVDIAAELKADLRFQHALFTTPTMMAKQKEFSNKTWGRDVVIAGDCLEYTADTVETIVTEVGKARKYAKEKGVFLDTLPWLANDEEIREYYLNVEGWTKKPTCHSAWSTLRIADNGDIYPCLKIIGGNIRRDEFSKIVNSPALNEFRQVMNQVKLMPACHRCCKL